MTTDYAEQRKAYISQVRSSFEAGSVKEAAEDTENRDAGGVWRRFRFAAALLLFLLFVCWQGSGEVIGGFTPEKVVEMIEDTRYDTILQACDAVLGAPEE